MLQPQAGSWSWGGDSWAALVAGIQNCAPSRLEHRRSMRNLFLKQLFFFKQKMRPGELVKESLLIRIFMAIFFFSLFAC